NARECLNDEDMRLGRITTNKILLNQNELSLFLNLGDSEIIYIFKKSTPEKKQENYLEKKKNEYL
ncbi:MAG TPA: hypothetical protein PLJ21_11630, partial [Pseudobdellovibrionaceae bacterium]|nr:hypothetical protein [Pseudobdellovibrionaceae bacterium]